MGKAMSVMARPFINFNVRQRAHKRIENLRAAPQYPSTTEMIKEVQQRYPDISITQQTKDEDLMKKLKVVYVTSRDPVQLTELKEGEEASEGNRNRSLPSNRRMVEESVMGIPDPERIPIGRMSLRQALKFISDHQADPEVHTVAAIAERHHLDVNVTERVLQHFATFRLHLPVQDDDDDSKARRVPLLFSPIQQRLAEVAMAGKKTKKQKAEQDPEKDSKPE